VTVRIDQRGLGRLVDESWEVDICMIWFDYNVEAEFLCVISGIVQIERGMMVT
jgi:hypothetical protein